MSVKFLSDEFMEEATRALNEDADLAGSLAGVDLALQFIVTDAPEGEIHYYMKIADGKAEVARGDLDEPDVTITNDYETAVGISKGEVNTQMAFMTGKLKVNGNMAKLMMNQGVINAITAAMGQMDLEY